MPGSRVFVPGVVQSVHHVDAGLLSFPRIALAFPLIILELWGFIKPALTDEERKPD